MPTQRTNRTRRAIDRCGFAGSGGRRPSRRDRSHISGEGQRDTVTAAAQAAWIDRIRKLDYELHATPYMSDPAELLTVGDGDHPHPRSIPGLPRAVNNLAVQALIAAYANNAAILDDKATPAAVTEVNAE